MARSISASPNPLKIAIAIAPLAAIITGLTPDRAFAGDTPRMPLLERDPASAEELGCDAILFVRRKPYSSDHYYTDIDNGTREDRFVPENGIYLLDLRTRDVRPVVTAAELPGGRGFIGKAELSFDARRVVFDFRESPRSAFRIWEVGLDGTGLRQLTTAPLDEAAKVARWGKPWHTDDIHPAYLPDGGVVFSSTRAEHTVLCGGSAHLSVPLLHRMDRDGRGIEQLTRSPVSELCPTPLDDGRVLYHRWEYIDKGARVAKTICAMNPDGTRATELYGVADDTTTVYMYPRPLPGRGGRIVSVGTCHYPQGGCVGAIFVVDPSHASRERGPDPDEPGWQTVDPRHPVTNITPHVFIERRTEPGWHFLGADGTYRQDETGRSGHLYTHPFPVSETELLVTMKANPEDHYQDVPNAYSIWLLGLDGRHRFVYADDELSCWHPIPVRSRPVPPTIATARDAELAARGRALCLVSDVYRGMEGVERGEIRWLRILEAVPRYWDTGRRWSPSLSSSGWKAALWPRVQWGVVPVEADGSAHFEVPADRAIFLQALDDEFREVQRERTYVNYRAGEVRSCGGCHSGASREVPAASSTPPIAARRAPSRPRPQPCDLSENSGDGRAEQTIHYPTDIQPILDARCVACHGPAEPAAGLRLTGDVTLYYSTSYEELAKRQLAGPIVAEFTSFLDGDRGNYNGARLPPDRLGSRHSVLDALLTEPGRRKNAEVDHSHLLSGMELMVLRRWMDSNYQFYGSYYGRHHPRWTEADPDDPDYDPADFRREATFEEAISDRAPAWHR